MKSAWNFPGNASTPILIFSILILLAACVPVTTPTSSTSAPTEATAAAPAEATPEVITEATEEVSDTTVHPVTIEHKYGSATITERPKRTITVGLVEQDALLALGIVPVGVTSWFGAYPGEIGPWALDDLEALGGELPVVVGDSATLNMETIVGLEPDLIIAMYSGIDENQYNLLSEIAPTIAQPADYVDYGVPWQLSTRTVGQAVGQSEEAEALIASVEELFVQAQAEHPEFVGAIGLGGLASEGDPWIYGPGDPRSRMLLALGFQLPPFADELLQEGDFTFQLSLERADLLDQADVMVRV